MDCASQFFFGCCTNYVHFNLVTSSRVAGGRLSDGAALRRCSALLRRIVSLHPISGGWWGGAMPGRGGPAARLRPSSALPPASSRPAILFLCVGKPNSAPQCGDSPLVALQLSVSRPAPYSEYDS